MAKICVGITLMVQKNETNRNKRKCIQFKFVRLFTAGCLCRLLFFFGASFQHCDLLLLAVKRAIVMSDVSGGRTSWGAIPLPLRTMRKSKCSKNPGRAQKKYDENEGENGIPLPEKGMPNYFNSAQKKVGFPFHSRWTTKISFTFPRFPR